ncbi:MAG: urea carboxylase-associated family protein [Candidatus Eremiobacteraeota bacterium]|nr:urea carboxylase-associated family protein [Candidatus Eremiobacteraeota bacterium]
MPLPPPFVEIPAQSGAALVVRHGDMVRVVDPFGQQVADVALYDAADPRDFFSPGRTIDYNASLRLRPGDCLYSQRGVALARVVEDTVGTHDMLLAPCSRRMFARRGESGHPSCHASMTAALSPFGIDADMITATLNVFMHVAVSSSGSIRILPPASRPGDAFALEALVDIVVAITACASELTNNGSCKPIRYALICGTPPGCIER